MATYLILGGAGFLGLNLARSLTGNGALVHLADRNFTLLERAGMAGKVSLLSTSYADRDRIISYIDEHAIDVVIDLVSGLLPGSSFEAFTAEHENVLLPATILVKELAARGIHYIYFSSGGAVYGNSANESLDENTECAPISYYGQAKLLMENQIRFFHRKEGLEYLILRPSNPYGPLQDPSRKQGFIATALQTMLTSQRLEIWGDGHVIRDYIYVEDLTNAVGSLLQNGIKNETVNIGSGSGTSLRQVIAVLETVTGKSADVSYGKGRAVDVRKVVLDVTKLHSLVDFAPRDIEAGIEQYYKSLSENP